jgi:hypothetical protein
LQRNAKNLIKNTTTTGAGASTTIAIATVRSAATSADNQSLY